MGVQILFARFTYSFILFLFQSLFGQFQLDHIQHCIWIAGKYTGTGSTVHGLLAALAAF